MRHNAATRARFNEPPHPENPAELCEQRVDGRSESKVLTLPHSVALVPNYGEQELVGAFGRAAVEAGRKALGFAA